MTLNTSWKLFLYFITTFMKVIMFVIWNLYTKITFLLYLDKYSLLAHNIVTGNSTCQTIIVFV